MKTDSFFCIQAGHSGDNMQRGLQLSSKSFCSGMLRGRRSEFFLSMSRWLYHDEHYVRPDGNENLTCIEVIYILPFKTPRFSRTAVVSKNGRTQHLIQPRQILIRGIMVEPLVATVLPTASKCSSFTFPSWVSSNS